MSKKPLIFFFFLFFLFYFHCSRQVPAETGFKLLTLPSIPSPLWRHSYFSNRLYIFYRGKPQQFCQIHTVIARLFSV